MGYYTHLKFTGSVKPEYQEVLRKEYESWKDLAKKYDFIKEFADLPRADFIPRGYAHEYGEWGCGSPRYNIIHYDEWDYYMLVWDFATEFKNYNSEIECFIKNVAINICDKFLAEVRGESDGLPCIWFYKNEKLICLEDF